VQHETARQLLRMKCGCYMQTSDLGTCCSTYRTRQLLRQPYPLAAPPPSPRHACWSTCVNHQRPLLGDCKNLALAASDHSRNCTPSSMDTSTKQFHPPPAASPVTGCAASTWVININAGSQQLLRCCIGAVVPC
jgi:hypothetical protein